MADRPAAAPGPPQRGSGEAPRGTGEAFARAALAGNPSDGYGGAVVALAFGDRRATAIARHGSRGAGAARHAPELVTATVRRFGTELHPGAGDVTVDWNSDIPRSVGLGGSSAIVIAVLRALCALHGVAIAPAALAELALSIERDDLDIAAGLQDRVAQTHGPLTFMDFAPTPARYMALDPRSLPPLLIAWRAATARESRAVHAPLHARFAGGEPAVHGAMRTLAGHAWTAAAALRDADHAALRAAVDGSFEARASILALDPLHVEMIETARGAGAAANYTGSGGAIIAVCDDAVQRERVAVALAAIGCESLEPTIGLATTS